ncbi:MAG: hypothetical protein V1887_02070 [Candidatus Aenigmatarchaeota archaeon]
MAEYEDCRCVFGFKTGDSRDDNEVVSALPAYLGKKALIKYFKDTTSPILSVREASITMTLTYERRPENEDSISEVEDLEAELPDSRDPKIVKSEEKIVGYKCRNETCDKCPCLVDKDVYRILRAGKKK